MTTPYDLYVDMLSKQSADALIPGQVGMGVNSGHQDSDASEATSSALARNRADMQALALIAGSADGGAGYSTPAPGMSPSMQMQADVKAAAVVDEAIKFAEYVYMVNKQANEGNVTSGAAEGATEAVPSEGAMARMRQFGTDFLEAAKGKKGLGMQAAAIGVPTAAVLGLGYGGYRMMQPEPAPAPMPVPDDALKTAAAVLDALGLEAVQKQAFLGKTPILVDPAERALIESHRAGVAANVGGAVTRGIQKTIDASKRLAANPHARAAALVAGGGLAAGGGMYAYDQMKEANDAGALARAQAFMKGKYDAGMELAAKYPGRAMGGAAVLGTAGGALGMFGAHQYAAAQQAAQMAAAQEAGLARPEDASLGAMKEAALAGQQFALQQMGLI